MEDLLQKTDAEILTIARQLRTAYQLKRTLRYATTRDHSVHSESVAEHVFGIIFVAQYFLRVEPSAAALDHEKVYSLLLFHDFGEIKHGDIPYHWKTREDEERERLAAGEIFDGLPDPLGEIGRSNWLEYDLQKSAEARFAYAIDKIEPLFELLDPVSEQSLKRTKFDYLMHTEKKLKATGSFPVMRRFIEVVSEDMLERGVFWEKEVV